MRNVPGAVIFSLGETFLESLHLDLKCEADLLLLVEFSGEVGKALLMAVFEAFKISTQLLDLGLHVAGLIGMRRCCIWSTYDKTTHNHTQFRHAMTSHRSFVAC